MITSPLPWSYRILVGTQFDGGGSECLLLDRNGMVIGVIHDSNNAELIIQTLQENERLKDEILSLEIELSEQQ